MNAIYRMGILALLFVASFASAQSSSAWTATDGHHSRTVTPATFSDSSPTVVSIVGKLEELRAQRSSSADPRLALLAAGSIGTHLCSLQFTPETELLALPIGSSDFHPARGPPSQHI
jgi:hypothetical protein